MNFELNSLHSLQFINQSTTKQNELYVKNRLSIQKDFLDLDGFEPSRRLPKLLFLVGISYRQIKTLRTTNKTVSGQKIDIHGLLTTFLFGHWTCFMA